MLSTLTDPLINSSTASQAARWLSVTLVAGLVIGNVYTWGRLNDVRVVNSEKETVAQGVTTLQQAMYQSVKTVTAKINEAEALGADVTSAKAALAETKKKAFDSGQYVEALLQLEAQLKTMNQLISDQTAANALSQAEKQKGTLVGKVKEGSTGLKDVKVTLKDGSTEIGSATSGADGGYSLVVKAGTYTLTAVKSGYATFNKNSVVITAEQTATLDIGLTKATTSAPATSTGSATNGESSYEVASVNGYTIHLSKFNLASGQFRVMTDTANDDDCADDCPVKSLSSYVSGNGGFAGLNGTYFCPADYASCTNETNAFFWKVYNSRLSKVINANNGLGENESFIAFASDGSVRWFSSWTSYKNSGFAAAAGLNCFPTLVSGGDNVVSPSSLDEKQRNTKSNRGAIGLKGQVLYLVVAKSATVVDLAGIMDALDVDYALNVDGGGSSAMIFNNSYKVGPGRAIPNAIVVARR